jgi:hypothetical protein
VVPKNVRKQQKSAPLRECGPHIPPAPRPTDSGITNLLVCNARWQRSQRTASPLVAAAKAAITSFPPRWECVASSRLPSMRRFLQLHGLVAVGQGALQLGSPILDVGEVTGLAISCSATDLLQRTLTFDSSRKGLI